MHPKVGSALDTSSIEYRIWKHAELSAPIRNPQDFANALQYPLARITKSVLFRAEPQKTYCLIVCSIDRKIDLTQLAAIMHAKRMQVANADELERLTNYPSRGVSPLGVEALPIYMDEYVLSFPSILIGAGEAGVEVELKPADLQYLTTAIVVPITIAPVQN